MTDRAANRSPSNFGLAVVVEVRHTERGHTEVVLDAQFDGDPFLTTLRRRWNGVSDLTPGRLVAIRRLETGEIVVTPGGTDVSREDEPV